MNNKKNIINTLPLGDISKYKISEDINWNKFTPLVPTHYELIFEPTIKVTDETNEKIELIGVYKHVIPLNWPTNTPLKNIYFDIKSKYEEFKNEAKKVLPPFKDGDFPTFDFWLDVNQHLFQ